MRRSLHSARRLLLWTAGAAVVASLVLLVAAPALGWRALTVRSGSMEPALAVGDVIVEREVRAADVKPGAIVTFRDPASGALITHRVAAASLADGTARFVTRGDANTGAERWAVPASSTVGLVEHRIPKVGYVAGYAGTRPAAFAVVLALFALLALELRALWRPPRPGGSTRAAKLLEGQP